LEPEILALIERAPKSGVLQPLPDGGSRFCCRNGTIGAASQPI